MSTVVWTVSERPDQLATLKGYSVMLPWFAVLMTIAGIFLAALAGMSDGVAAPGLVRS